MTHLIPEGTWPTTSGWPYAGLECGQGFLWTLFYGNGRGAANATSKLATEAHKKFPAAFPRQVIFLFPAAFPRLAIFFKKKSVTPAF